MCVLSEGPRPSAAASKYPTDSDLTATRRAGSEEKVGMSQTSLSPLGAFALRLDNFNTRVGDLKNPWLNIGGMR